MAYGLRDGTKREHWVCGSVQGTEYLGLMHYRGREFYTWTPQVASGRYSVFSDIRPLFSDRSLSHTIKTSSNGLMYVDIHEDAVHESAFVAMYKREDDLIVSLLRRFEYVDAFAGELDEDQNERLTADVDDVVDISLLAERKYEFKILNDRLWLNGDHRVSVGTWTAGEIPPLEILENQGILYGEGRAAFTKYFPVDKATVRVFVDNGTEVEEWTQVETLSFSLENEKHFEVDEDLGIIYIGGSQAEDLVLAEDLSASALTILVYRNPEAMATWPAQGIIRIGTEDIMYLEKGNAGFYQCIRAYNGTTAQEHTAGATVGNVRRGYAAEGDLYIAYDAVPRVDYELSDYAIRSANKSPWLDIMPSRQVDATGILQIINKERSIASIKLDTDALSIGGTLYGPVYFGTAATRLTATAYDHQGEPVEDVEITITITSGGGTVNAQYPSVTDTSNSIGEVYATYHNPLSPDNTEIVVQSVTHDGSDTRMTVLALSDDTQVDEIWVYQVLKHDRILGTVGLSREITAYNTATEPYGRSYIDIDGLVGDSYVDGIISVYEGGTTRAFRNITFIDTVEGVDSIKHSRVYLDDVLTDVVGQAVHLLEAGAIQWDPDALNGMRRIVYEFTEGAVHPLTGENGAYMPLRPSSIDGLDVVFSDRLLPIPDPDNDAVNLGAYVLVTNSVAKFEATARDPATGKLITSNEIRLKIILPSTMIGADLSGALPIPYGWTLATDEFNVGAAVSGSNFITINPRAQGINSFCMLGQIT